MSAVPDKSTLGDWAYEQIRKMIIFGKLVPRERLSETKLAEELQISRTPIREGIRRLEQDGLVSRDSLGAYVTSLTKEEAMELYQVRIELEMLAVRLAGQNADKQDLDVLTDIANNIEQLLSSKAEVSQVITVNGAFHDHFARISHNSYLQYTLEDIRSRLSLLRVSSLMASRRGESSLREHLTIARTFLAGDYPTAATLMHEHAKTAAEFALSNLII